MPAIAIESRVQFHLRSGWGTFETTGGRRPKDPLRGQLGLPGLWKLSANGHGATAHRVFELPPSITPRRDAEPARFDLLSAWAHATVDGRPDRGWSPPPREDIERLLPEGALTLQVGAVALQGALDHDDSRLALDFPIVPRIPDDLPPARAAWLEELLADAQNRWRMVRIGIDGVTAAAQIDLSGAPHDTLAPLVRIGVDALRHVVSSLVEPADFLVNGADGSRAVEVPPTKPKSQKKAKPKPKRRKTP